ncbi:MAG: sulfur-carrier protein [Actinomycetota bacterium]|jgi:molybdopterin converting factor small subunit|nr:sulfur-carrier protein [Actinomycetota bacterium]
MRITVVCFGALRERVPGAGEGPVEIDLPDGASVADVVEALSIPRALASMVLVDGNRVELDEVVSEGAAVTLMPPFAGGAT